MNKVSTNLDFFPHLSFNNTFHHLNQVHIFENFFSLKEVFSTSPIHMQSLRWLRKYRHLEIAWL